LINCHAQYYCKNFEETTLKDWDDCMNENCRSMVHFTSLAVPFLENSLGNKSIVFLTQNVEDKPIPGEMIYAVSKV
jgi:NADP-dependent 3-hydroxy acid dehydrogenase YdfG